MGNREFHLKRALSLLAKKGVIIVRLSSLYETEPIGFQAQPMFLNMAAVVESALDPASLLKALKSIEKKIGRKPSLPGHSRCIDIDILLAETLVFSSPGLIIPHPRMHERLFALIPLAEIAPDEIHPVFNLTIKSLKENCDEPGFIKKTGTPDFSNL